MGLRIVIENEMDEESGDEEEVGCCTTCGEDIDMDDKFCSGCGKKLPVLTGPKTAARLSAINKAITPMEEEDC